MSILETFYILFKSDAKEAADDIKKIDKSADAAEGGLSDMADAAKAAKKSMADVESQADDLAQSVVQMGKNLLAPAAILASIGALASAAIGRAAEIRELDQFSSKINSSIGDVDAFQRAVKGMGGETAGAVDSMVKLGEKINEAFADGGSAARKDFEAWGVAFTDAEGAALGASEGMLELAANLETVSQAEALARIKKLGIEDAATIDLLLQGRAAVEAKIDAEKRLGVVTEEQAAATRDYYAALGGLGNRMTSLGNGLVSTFIPAASAVINALSDAFDWMRENQQLVEGFFIGVAGVLTAMYLPAILSAAAATIVAIAPFLAVGAAIAAVAAAFALAYDDVRAFLDGQPSLIGALAEQYEWFGAIVDGIGGVFTNLKTGGVAALDALAVAWDAVVAGADAAWTAISNFFGQFEPLASAAIGLVGDIVDLFAAVASEVRGGIIDALDWLGEKLNSVGEAAADFLRPMLDGLQPIVDAVTVAAAAIEDGFVGAFNAIRAVWDATLGAITSGIDSIRGGIQNVTAFIRGGLGGDESAPDTSASGGEGRSWAEWWRGDAANDNSVEAGQRMLASASGAAINGQTAQSVAPAVTNNDIKNTVKVGGVVIKEAPNAAAIASQIEGALSSKLRETASQFDDGVAR